MPRMHQALSLAAALTLVACADPGGTLPVTASPPTPPTDDVTASGDAGPDTTSMTDAGVNPTTDVSGEDGPAPVEDAPVQPPDVAAPDGAPGTDAEAPAEPIKLGGGVLIFELGSEFLDIAGAGARFTDDAPLDGDGDIYGPCVVAPTDPDAESESAYGYDAGIITVSGTAPSVTLSPQDEGVSGTGYATDLPEDPETLLPAGGAILTMNGGGGADIGPFTLFVQVPEPMNVTGPSTGLFDSVGTSGDLTVSWSAGNGESVLVTLSPVSLTFQPIAGLAIACGVEGDPGVLVIPQAALAALKADGADKVILGITRIVTGDAEAGPYTVSATVTRSSGGPLGLN